MTALEKAQALCQQADALLITAGAGMGVDSGLPDFRGPEGFWRAYPAYQRLGFNFREMACPDRFEDNPALGWGFYGHRFNLYRETMPHEGFRKLLEFGNRLPGGYFVYTSNVDGHFQAAGFDPSRVLECHGSIRHHQCFTNCTPAIWDAPDEPVPIDHNTMQAQAPFPACRQCGSLARPNILMFGDWGWNPARSDAQEERYLTWLRGLAGKRLVILEFGAGLGVPTVRYQSERVASSVRSAALIRVNPREPQGPNPGDLQISLSLGGLAAIRQLFGS